MIFKFLHIHLFWLFFLSACSSNLEKTSSSSGTRSSCFKITTPKKNQVTITQYLTQDAQGPCPKDVKIPNGIQVIEEEAFADLALTSVQFPESVIQVKSRAFAGNPNLATVHIPNLEVTVEGGNPNTNATRKVFPNGYLVGGTRLSCFEFKIEEDLNNNFFIHYVATGYKESDEQGLCPKEVLLPKGLDIIGEEAFLNQNLTNFQILYSVRKVRDRAFVGNPDLPPIRIKYILIPTVADNAFPNGWYHGSRADCYKIKGGDNGKVIVVEYKRYRKKGKVEGCNAYLSIPYGVTHIANKAGYNKLLISVVLSSTVTHIGHTAFSFNTAISSIVIPSSVISIGESAFATNVIESVTFNNGLKSIGKGAFGRNELTTVTIPDSVTTIGDSAFHNNSIKTVTFGSGVSKIGRAAFANNLLSTVTIPDGVTEIKDSTFINNDLTSITLGSNITTIGRLAFSDDLSEHNNDFDNLTNERGDNRITEVTLPNTLTSIGSGAFFGNALTSVTIPDSVEQILCVVFRNNNLNSVDFGTNITFIGPGAFYGNNLSAAELPNSNVEIYSDTFDPEVSLTIAGGETFDTSSLPTLQCSY